MRHNDILAQLRQPGRTNEQISEILRAVASSLPRNKVQELLDICSDEIEDCTLALSDLDEWRRSEDVARQQAESIPRFIFGAV